MRRSVEEVVARWHGEASKSKPGRKADDPITTRDLRGADPLLRRLKELYPNAPQFQKGSKSSEE